MCDCKIGGYNLEGCYAVEARLSAIILIVLLLILAIIQGINIRTSGRALHLSSKRKSSIQRHMAFG